MRRNSFTWLLAAGFALVAGLGLFGLRQQGSANGPAWLKLQRVNDADKAVAIATDRSAPSGSRVSALGHVRRLDASRAVGVAESLLDVDAPDLRLSAAAICAEAGRPAGERALIDILRAEDLSLGFRGMAATALARGKSQPGHSAIIVVALQECEPNRGLHREGIQWELLEALSRYRDPADFGLVLELYRVTGLRAPGRPVGLFGRSESLLSLREALGRTQNAIFVIELELAIARSGGEDGVMFVRELLRRGASIGALEGTIDMYQENPLSGRLAENVLRDLGAHSSDRQFFDDTLSILRPSVCSFCGAVWAALARMGTQGNESKITELVESRMPNRTDDALRALAFNGATASVRNFAKRVNKERDAEMYLDAHAKGLDRDWYPLPKRGVY